MIIQRFVHLSTFFCLIINKYTNTKKDSIMLLNEIAPLYDQPSDVPMTPEEQDRQARAEQKARDTDKARVIAAQKKDRFERTQRYKHSKQCDLLVPVTVAGMPCLACAYNTNISAAYDPDGNEIGPDYDYGYEIYDRKGYPAPWLERKMTKDDESNVELAIMDAMDDDLTARNEY
jgi:hypothetical protein